MLRIFKWLGLLLVAVVVIALTLPWVPAWKDELGSGPYKAWTKANVVTLDLAAEDGGFLFDEAFYGKRLILMGEIHGAADPHVLDLALIKHLHATTGLRWLMAELDFAQSTLVNFYLLTGDETYIEPIFEAWAAEDAQWASREYVEKLRGLREFNRSVPDGEGVLVFGVDRVQDRAVALDVLKEYAEAQEQAASAVATNGVIPDWPATLAPAYAPDAEKSARIGALSAALVAVEDLPTAARDKGFVHLLRNLIALDEGATRYEAILANIAAMNAVFEIGDDEPLYGLWGFFHAIRAPVNEGARPLALRLNEEGPFAGAVGTIGFIYTGAESMTPSKMLPGPMAGEGTYTVIPFSQDFPYLYYQRGIYDLKAAAGDARASLIRLSGEGSPYANSARLGSASGLMTAMGEIDIAPSDPPAFDYVILSQGSPALTAYIGETEKN